MDFSNDTSMKRNCNDSMKRWTGAYRFEPENWPPSTNHWWRKWLNECRLSSRSKSSRQELQQLASQLLRAQEEERRRISRDLHDDINQRLALLAMEIEALERQLALSTTPCGPSRPCNTRPGCGVIRGCTSPGLSVSSLHSG